MALDYREVNMQLEPTANQLPYQPTLFQRLGATKVDNLWGYHHLRLTEDSSKVTAIINPWGVYRFHACLLGISTAPGAGGSQFTSLLSSDLCSTITRKRTDWSREETKTYDLWIS